MQVDEQQFYSDGVRLQAAFYHPDPGQAVRRDPIVVACSGFLGLRNIHPERLARALTPRGFSVFGFDYRGFAPSDGRRGDVVLDEQARDIANAVRMVRAALPDRPLVLAGWAMSAGLILRATKLVDQVAGLICLNGFYDATRVQRALRGPEGWDRFRSQLQELQVRSLAQPEPLAVDPFFVYPLDPVTRTYVDNVLRRDPDFGPKVWLSFADSLLSWRPEVDLEHLDHTPLLIVHGDNNALHPPEEARSLHAAYPGPKQLCWLAGAGHTEWMHDDHVTFCSMIDTMEAWLKQL